MDTSIRRLGHNLDTSGIQNIRSTLCLCRMFGLTPIPTFQAFVGLLLDTKYKLAMLIALNFV